MLLRSTTEYENRQTIPLLGGARAFRPWGGLCIREPTPSLRDRRRCAPPLHGGDFHGSPRPVFVRVCLVTG
jgi:hypothetical protein